jgi:hypothetical protein
MTYLYLVSRVSIIFLNSSLQRFYFPREWYLDGRNELASDLFWHVLGQSSMFCCAVFRDGQYRTAVDSLDGVLFGTGGNGFGTQRHLEASR